MTGYVRTDTTNNIADGNIINAADLDNEFDGVQAAFNSSTGHNHDGTTGEGAPILALGPTQDVVVSTGSITPKTTNIVDIGSNSLKFKNLNLAGNAVIDGTLNVTGIATFTAQPVLSSLTASRAVFTDGSKGLVSNAITGTGNVVMSTSPTLVTPVLGTPTSATLTNATGLPIASGVSGLATGVATFLGTPSSANLAATVTDETGTGSLVFSNSPTLVTPVLGTPSSATLTNATGLPIDGGTTGTLPVGRGGTGATSLTANNVILGNGTSAVQVVAPGTSGNVLTSNGTTWSSSAPTAQVYPAAGMAVSTGTAWGTSKSTPTGDVVGTTDTQTLTNKTLTTPVISSISNTGTLTLPTSTDTLVGRATTDTLTNKTLTSPTMTGAVLNDGYTEEVFDITGTTPAISPTNGSIQTWTLTANSTPTAGTWAAGQSITLMVNDSASSFTVTWTSLPVVWVGGFAPALAPASGFTVITFWKVGTTIYGALVGQVA